MRSFYSLTKLLILFLLVCFAVLAQPHCKSSDPRPESTDVELIRKKGSTDALGAALFELRMTADPATGKIPPGARSAELVQAEELVNVPFGMMAPVSSTYSFAGPNNLGGRTRAIAYDVRYNGSSNQTILAGGVSGGVYKSTDNGATWVRKSPTTSHYSTTSIAQDPRVGFQDTWYYATGEHLGNSASALRNPSVSTDALYFGDGIYKSTDNGETWTKLTNSNTGVLETFDRREDLITKVVVNPVNGHVYFSGINSIFRSTNGGSTWSLVLSSLSGSLSTAFTTDIVVTSTGRLYAAFDGDTFNGSGSTPNIAGVWTSTTGDALSWTKIAGELAPTNPVGWLTNSEYGRIVLALGSGANENILYAAYWDSTFSACNLAPAPEAHLFKWNQTTSTWTNLTANLPDEPGCLEGNDPFAVQAGYNLVLAVHPDNDDTVFIGGTNLYRSTDGFASTANTTRIGGYADVLDYGLYTNSHPDIHSIVFSPTNSSIMLCGNDGGIQRTTNNLAANVAWTQLNTGFRTFQFYDVCVDPRSGNTKVMGGAQDNGTTRNIGGSGSNFEQVFPGDGVSVGLSNNLGGTFYEFVGAQFGVIYRRSSASFPNTGTDIEPTSASGNGLFVTLFELDPDNTQNIYYADAQTLYRNTSSSTATKNNWTLLTGVGTAVSAVANKYITALATTRGTYNASTASLFIGTEDGRLFRLNDPANVAANTAPTAIRGGSFPAGYISSIAVNPRNDDTILVTFSSYNTTSIWWTGNANAATPTWLNVEGGLTTPSVRSSAIAITGSGVEYFVGTSVGLYSALIDASAPASTSWIKEGAGEMGNAVVSSLALRTLDNRLVVGTHGYGMWQSQLSTSAVPVTLLSFSGKTDKHVNQLTWTTESEVNNKGFAIERKYDAEIHFTTIGFVPASTTTQSRKSYSFQDAFVDLGKSKATYRLRQTDIDGKTTYSYSITLNRTTSAKFVEYVATEGSTLFVRINNGSPAVMIRYRIYDMNGKKLTDQQVPYQSQKISIGTLRSGSYVLEIVGTNGNRYTKKFMR
jgi:hypothetical protein